MFTEHDILILRENGFHIFPRENNGVDWAMTETIKGIKSIIANFPDGFFVKIILDYKISDSLLRISTEDNIEDAIQKAKEIREAIESDRLLGGRHERI